MRGLGRIKKLYDGYCHRRDKRRAQRATDRALRAVAAFPSTTNKQAHGLGSKLIVSLTSYPPRFPTLALTLCSLLDQRTKADHVVLWVTARDAPVLPKEVHDLRTSGLEIRLVEDLRSYKKLIPALDAYPDSTIVTADDDIYYPPDWLTKLVAGSKAHPGAIVGHRCHLAITGTDGQLMPYKEWTHETSAISAAADREYLFPTGTGGVLYPPGSLSAEVTDQNLFMTLCPKADDLWFFWMARRIGTTHRKVRGRCTLISWPDSQDVALWRSNVEEEGNDVAIRSLEAALGLIGNRGQEIT